jgi:hypothetical protein
MSSRVRQPPRMHLKNSLVTLRSFQSFYDPLSTFYNSTTLRSVQLSRDHVSTLHLCLIGLCFLAQLLFLATHCSLRRLAPNLSYFGFTWGILFWITSATLGPTQATCGLLQLPGVDFHRLILVSITWGWPQSALKPNTAQPLCSLVTFTSLLRPSEGPAI